MRNTNFWSFSKLIEYEGCPYRRKLWLDGAEKPPYEENRGTRIHKAAEAYVKGEIEDLPGELKHFEKEFLEEREMFAAGKLEVETEWAFDSEWRIVDWRDDNAWLRMALDQWVVPDGGYAVIRDHKTGKQMFNEVKHNMQGQLYMIGAFMRYPDLKSVEVRFRYLDMPKETRKLYTRDDKLLTLFEKWNGRAHKMLNDAELRVKPNRMNCRFCDYGINKGSGACAFAIPWE